MNILTNLAVNKGQITVFGGTQKRPNLHIEDMTDLYLLLLELPDEKIHKKIFNAGYENFTVGELANKVNTILGGAIPIITTPSNDTRSYHVSSKKIKAELGFEPQHTIEDAIRDLKEAFEAGKIPNPLEGIRYYNIKTMQAVNLK